MKSQVLLTVWCHISGEAAGEIWRWSLSGVKGLNQWVFLFIVSYHRYRRCYNTSNGSSPVPSLEGKDSLLMGNYTTRSDKVKKCAQASYGRGFKYFAMIRSGECLATSNRSLFIKYGWTMTYDKYCPPGYTPDYCYYYEVKCGDGLGSELKMNVYWINYGEPRACACLAPGWTNGRTNRWTNERTDWRKITDERTDGRKSHERTNR